MPSVVCPQCGHEDQVRKVTAVVTEGIREMRSSGGFGGITYSDGKWGVFGGPSATRGEMSTLLAQRLMPPDEPKVHLPWYLNPLSHSCWTKVLSILSILFIVSAIVLVIPAVLGLFSGDFTAASAFCQAVFYGLWFGLVARYLSRRRASYSKEKERVAAERVVWERAIARWNCLYYCFRDDIVFDPETGEWCDPAQLHEFLYAPFTQIQGRTSIEKV